MPVQGDAAADYDDISKSEKIIYVYACMPEDHCNDQILWTGR
jgi:hypothetical protein